MSISCTIAYSANYRNDMVYIFDTARAFEYCNQLSYDYLQTPLRLTRNQCSACSRLMSYHVGGPYATIENGPLRMLQCCVTCSGALPGSVPLTSLTCFTWNFTSPLKSLMSIYTSVLRGSPDAQLQFIRGWIVNFFRELVNRLQLGLVLHSIPHISQIYIVDIYHRYIHYP